MGELIRALSSDGFVKITVVELKDAVECARNIHRTLPTATAALGRTLAAASMLGNAQKGAGNSVTVRINGGGPLGTILAVSNERGDVRGYVQNPDVDPPLRSDGKLNVGAAVGRDGMLTVIRDLGFGKPVSGATGLVSGEIAEDLAQYFVESEQIPTVCALGVLVDRDQSVLAAGGYIAQLLPGAGEEHISRLERNVQASGPVTGLLMNGTPEEAAMRVLAGFKPSVLVRESVGYRCDCSRDRVLSALSTVPAAQLREMLAEDGKIEVRCRFCNVAYSFGECDIADVENFVSSSPTEALS